MQIYPAFKGLFRTLFGFVFMAGVFADLLKFLHKNHCHSMRGMIEWTYGPEVIKCFHMRVDLRANLFEAGLCQRDKIKTCLQQLGKILFRIVAVISNYFCSIHT